ncbi:hypothetical protein DERP_008555 [Dermatophagoides pteronyssinus]|uniref:Uncharacterized protein LOC113792092 isoform X1 n=2 Tax=Dermatophagoides pteronyssinus TaxID=6956 RepID=A0A6P6XXC7_DERPT|nr:uncharacterized protein LOC113792092 isoform X1 [Dermatophagoides pteronyssinus]KAH9414715.1 hypothetical protein DERP_008555 [Dermatophagoides pteronyssinus]
MDQTLFLILIDESLSMRMKRQEVVDGINRYIEVQREINPNSNDRLIMIKFNNNITVMYKGININMVEPLRLYDYNPSGRTGLFDAVKCALELADEIRNDHERVVCIMVTDGQDNASQQNQSCKAIQKMVKKYEMKNDWSFTYMEKPSEYWSRKNPVSKISYKAKRPCYSTMTNTSAVAQRRLRSSQLQSVVSS